VLAKDRRVWARESKQPHYAPSGFATMPPARMVAAIDHPDTASASITVMRRSAMRSRQSPLAPL